MSDSKQTLKILTCGDPHFKVNNAIETEEMTKKFISLASSLKPDKIIILGDILDRHETLHVSPLDRAISFLSECCEIAPTVILIGNHDRPSNSIFCTSEHPFNALKKWKNMIVVDVPKVEIIKNHKMVYVPYVPPGRFQESLDLLDNNDETKDQSEDKSETVSPTVIFAHQEFKGAKMGAIISEEGDSWSLQNPLVVSGHIHDFDHLQNNIIYTGTPIQHGFGDTSKKSVSYFIFDSLSNFQHQRIPLNCAERKTINILGTDLSILNNERPSPFLRIVVSGTKEQIKFVSSSSIISLFLSKGTKVVYREKREKITSNTKANISFLDRLFPLLDSDDLRYLATQIFSN